MADKTCIKNLSTCKQNIQANNVNPVKDTKFTFIDLFAGIGGFRLGFEHIGGECIFTAEMNQYSRETYRANYICNHPIVDDLTKVKLSEIPNHDILLAGFPCQPFSLAGVSKFNAIGRPHGFSCKKQGNLFFNIVDIIKKHRPKAFLLENVKNLLHHNKGRTFEIILKTLKYDLGYQLDHKVIDASSFVPQQRKRVFLVGFRKENGFSFDKLEIPDSTSGPTLKSILHPEDSSEISDEKYISGRKGMVMEKYTLTDHLWNYLQEYASKHKTRGNGFGYSLVGPNDVARTLSARYHKDGSEILIRQRGKSNPRRLTPRECARLMGFEKLNGKTKFDIPVSDAQAYRQFGNAVVVPVVKLIAEHMRPWI